MFGNNSVGSDTFPCSDGRSLVDRFNCPEARHIISVAVHFAASSTAGTTIKALVLADNAGSPGAVLGVGTATAVPAGGGWVTCDLSLDVAAGNYWLGFVGNSFTANVTHNTATGVAPNMAMANGSFNYATPPGTWPGSDATYASMLSAYANDEPQSGGDVAPTVTTAPVISGSVYAGSTLTCTPGTYEGTPVPTVTRQWRLDGTNISGATGTTYVTSEGEVGGDITVRETATNTEGSVTSDSNVIEVVSASGVFQLGDTGSNGAGNWPTGANRALMRKITVTETITLIEFKMRMRPDSAGVGDVFKGLMYAADGADTEPGTLLAVSVPTAATTGVGGELMTATVPNVVIEPQDVWIGYVCNGGAGGASETDSGGQITNVAIMLNSGETNYASPSDPCGNWPGSPGPYTNVPALWFDYELGGTSDVTGTVVTTHAAATPVVARKAAATTATTGHAATTPTTGTKATAQALTTGHTAATPATATTGRTGALEAAHVTAPAVSGAAVRMGAALTLHVADITASAVASRAAVVVTGHSTAAPVTGLKTTYGALLASAVQGTSTAGTKGASGTASALQSAATAATATKSAWRGVVVPVVQLVVVTGVGETDEVGEGVVLVTVQHTPQVLGRKDVAGAAALPVAAATPVTARRAAAGTVLTIHGSMTVVQATAGQLLTLPGTVAVASTVDRVVAVTGTISMVVNIPVQLEPVTV